MRKAIPAIILACVFLATGTRALWNHIFVTNHPDSFTDCATMEDSKRIGAFIRELSPSEPSITLEHDNFIFQEIWLEHRTLLTYPLVWLPKWKHTDTFNLSLRLADAPVPFDGNSDFPGFWIECEGVLYRYFDEHDYRFNICFASIPPEPIVLRVVDQKTKQTLTTLTLTTKK